MEKDQRIEVRLSRLWQTVGALFAICLVVSHLAVLWLSIFPEQPMSHEYLLAGLSGMVLVVPTCLFLFPCFIGHYPSWVVRLFGRKFLEQLVEQCQIHLGDSRIGRGELRSPLSWLNDHRLVWLLIIGGGFVLGLVKSLKG
jgi:hypothetical protein